LRVFSHSPYGQLVSCPLKARELSSKARELSLQHKQKNAPILPYHCKKKNSIKKNQSRTDSSRAVPLKLVSYPIKLESCPYNTNKKMLQSCLIIAKKKILLKNINPVRTARELSP